MIMRLVLPRYEKVHFLSGICSLFMRKEDEVHYIGGAEILPPPLEGEREAYCIRMLDGVHAERARKELIEHNLRLVVYIAKKFDNTGVQISFFSLSRSVCPNISFTLRFTAPDAFFSTC